MRHLLCDYPPAPCHGPVRPGIQRTGILRPGKLIDIRAYVPRAKQLLASDAVKAEPAPCGVIAVSESAVFEHGFCLLRSEAERCRQAAALGKHRFLFHIVYRFEEFPVGIHQASCKYDFLNVAVRLDDAAEHTAKKYAHLPVVSVSCRIS